MKVSLLISIYRKRELKWKFSTEHFLRKFQMVWTHIGKKLVMIKISSKLSAFCQNWSVVISNKYFIELYLLNNFEFKLNNFDFFMYLKIMMMKLNGKIQLQFVVIMQQQQQKDSNTLLLRIGISWKYNNDNRNYESRK